MASNENIPSSNEDITATLVDLLVQKFPSIDREFVKQRLTQAPNLLEEFTYIINETNSQTVHDIVNDKIPQYIQELKELKTLLEQMRDMKAIESDEDRVKTQLERIKTILPENEYLYDLDVVKSRLETSQNAVIEADFIINEILTSSEIATTISPNISILKENPTHQNTRTDIVAPCDYGGPTSVACGPSGNETVASNSSISLYPSIPLNNKKSSNIGITQEKDVVACRNKTLKRLDPKVQNFNASGIKVAQLNKEEKRVETSSSTNYPRHPSSSCPSKEVNTQFGKESAGDNDGKSANQDTTPKKDTPALEVSSQLYHATLEIDITTEKTEIACRNKTVNNVDLQSHNKQKISFTKFIQTDNTENNDPKISSTNSCKPVKTVTELTETLFHEGRLSKNVVPQANDTTEIFEKEQPIKESLVLTEEDEHTFFRLYEMFPDIDPVFLTELMFREQLDLEDVANELVVIDYPKLRDRLHAEQRDRRREVLLSNNFTEANMNEILLIFDNDPKGYFCNTEKVVSDSYNKHAVVLLMAEFSSHENDVNSDLLKNNFHYYPTRTDLIEKFGNETNINFLQESFLLKLNWPDEIDQGFFREVQFAKFENIIQEELALRKTLRIKKIKHAIENDLLIECPTCLESECLETDMIFCDLCQHSFCQGCVKSHSNIQLGGGSQRVACMDPSCESIFGITTLSHIVSPQLIDLYWRRAIESKANLEHGQSLGFKECPFCSFKAVINDENDRIFKCFNPSCLKESCRKCNNENHIPFPCPTADSGDGNETMIRNFIANQMAEAMIRVCPNTNCGNRIVKESGCNEMTCPCGQKMCYVCKQPIQSDSHFQSNGCQQFTSLFEVNQLEAMRAGHDALQKFNQTQQQQNPDMISELIDEETSDDENVDGNLLHLELLLRVLQGRVRVLQIQEEITEQETAQSAQTSEQNNDSATCGTASPSPQRRQRRTRCVIQ